MLQQMNDIATPTAQYLAYNPFDGIVPTFGPFDAILKSKVGMFLSLTWAICFCITAYHLVVAFTKLSAAKKGGYGDSLDEAKGDALKAGAATIALTAAPVIYGILVGP